MGLVRDHAGLDLLQAIANILAAKAKFVTTSPITPAGERLCRFFGFRMIGRDRGIGNYPIYLLEVHAEWLTAKINALGRQGFPTTVVGQSEESERLLPGTNECEIVRNSQNTIAECDADRVH
jgi:hypothetical protein